MAEERLIAMSSDYLNNVADRGVGDLETRALPEKSPI